jgi:pilus assembly protein Flp/PilA
LALRLGEQAASNLLRRLPADGRESSMTKFVSRFMKDESGATAIEYGLIAALVAVAIASVLPLLGDKLKNTFGNVANQLPNS